MATEKETTAPIPSVAPDGEQPSALARTNSITDIEEPHKRFGKIQAMTMPELMETRFRVRPAVIDGLLTAGTYLLAGAPKIGKSFLVLQMAYQVSMGVPFLGFSSRQGTVLYLALEDTYERLQKRLAQMTEQDSEHLMQQAAEAAQRQQQHSEEEVADLQTELREERNFSFQQRVHISTLESRCRKAEKLLEMLPAEELKKFCQARECVFVRIC